LRLIRLPVPCRDAAMGLLQAQKQRKLLKRAANKGKKIDKGTDFEASSVLRSTEKAANAALLIQERCNACHGKTVRDVIGAMNNNGSRYSMADLKYDLKHERIAALPPGASAGPLPVGKARKAAPCFGKPMAAVNLTEFFRFLQCQLRMETNEHTGKDVELRDKDALAMWPDVVAFVTPNLGLTERWVPYHTILGVHEKFVVEAIHANQKWNEKQRFIAMFIFRAHCKRDLFTKAQLPIMLSKSFWQDPIKAFQPGGSMEKSILKYRKATGKPLLTSCFRIIPARVLKDDTENLVRSITNRSMNLIEVAELAFPIMKDAKRKPLEKLNAISKLVIDARGLGDTWAKMLTVVIDMGYPKERMMETQCDVGTGACAPLKALLPKGGPADKKEALKALLQTFNKAKGASTDHFWNVLKTVEGQLCTKFAKLPLICSQAHTKPGNMSAGTLQVQLCEYRQFRHSLARNRYGLPDDETMRGEFSTSTTLRPEDFIEYDKKRCCVKFDFPRDDKKITFEVSVKTTGGNTLVAERVAALCFKKFVDGETKESVQKYRDEAVKGYKGGEDVKENSEAWGVCTAQITHSCPLVSFMFEDKKGNKTSFQTTQMAAGGNILEAERIARLCWTKFTTGAKKEAVIEYRNDLYRKLRGESQMPPAKKQRTGGA